MTETPTKAACGAKTRSGGQCRRAPMANGRCYKHGGASDPPGPSHPNYRHGAYSQVWRNLSDVVDTAMQDTEGLLDPYQPVAGALAALEEAGRRYEEHDTPGFRRAAHGLFREWQTEDNPGKRAVLETQLGELLETGVRADVAFRDIVDRAETHRLAVNQAIKLMLDSKVALSLPMAIAAWDGLIQLVAEVCGVDQAREIAQRFDQERAGGKLAQAGYLLGGRKLG